MSKTKKIVTLPGDGIGPEVTQEAITVLKSACKKYDYEIQVEEKPFGGVSIEQFGTPLTEDTLDACRNASAVFLGAVGNPKFDDNPKEKRPEAGLLGIRKKLQLFANLRPIKIYEPLIDASSLKPEVIRDVDIMIVRELTGGIYFGTSDEEEDLAFDTMEYEQHEIYSIAKVAFDIAQKRRKNVCSVDKANVLDTSRLWRRTVTGYAPEWPDVTLQHMLVD
ncbi:MAG TPA: isocitrate/isopropylmalate family dehydrogenase, partial [Balneolaceae bacterium]|nr:isocitrate/isopropylmalate family dehydrogenase [Balneolaceae bacterium]